MYVARILSDALDVIYRPSCMNAADQIHAAVDEWFVVLGLNREPANMLHIDEMSEIGISAESSLWVGVKFNLAALH